MIDVAFLNEMVARLEKSRTPGARRALAQILTRYARLLPRGLS